MKVFQFSNLRKVFHLFLVTYSISMLLMACKTEEPITSLCLETITPEVVWRTKIDTPFMHSSMYPTWVDGRLIYAVEKNFLGITLRSCNPQTGDIIHSQYNLLSIVNNDYFVTPTKLGFRFLSEEIWTFSPTTGAYSSIFITDFVYFGLSWPVFGRNTLIDETHLLGMKRVVSDASTDFFILDTEDLTGINIFHNTKNNISDPIAGVTLAMPYDPVLWVDESSGDTILNYRRVLEDEQLFESFNLTQNTLLFSKRYDEINKKSTMPQFDNKRYVLEAKSGGLKNVTCIDIKAGDKIWTASVIEKALTSQIFIFGDKVILPFEPFTALDPNTGETLWQNSTINVGSNTLFEQDFVAFNGKLYFTDDNLLKVIDLNTGCVKFLFGTPSVTTPGDAFLPGFAIDQITGNIFIRDKDEIMCIKALE